MRFVTLEEARAAAGLKLVVAASLPSPWSEAAKGILHVKGIDALLVRFSSTDKAVREWMGWHNVPVLLVPGEPLRTHWTEILETAERLGADRGAARHSFRPTKTIACGSSGWRTSSSATTVSFGRAGCSSSTVGS